MREIVNSEARFRLRSSHCPIPQNGLASATSARPPLKAVERKQDSHNHTHLQTNIRWQHPFL